jgi:ribulose-phosphate 3-epimerase
MHPASRERVELAASLMCADFSRLAEQLDELREAGVPRLHLDFADGAFVPSLILGTEVFALLPDRGVFIVESHLMVREPARFVELFGRESDLVIVHAEALEDPAECFRRIREAGSRPGVALSPGTPAEVVEPLLPLVDQVLIMTVEPGFAGARFLPEMIAKVRRVRMLADQAGIELDIEVDGGVNPATIPLLAAAGANVFVGGSSGLFVDGHLRDAADHMLAAAQSADANLKPAVLGK